MNNEKEYTITDIYNKITEIEQRQRREKIFSIMISVVIFLLGYKIVKR